ncbi:hypothetical protein AAC387_Pa07g0826 [Persea americana]
MRTAVKLQIPVFLLGSKETWKMDITADENGGKAANSSFPPLGAEENWKTKFTADESGGETAIANFPPLEKEENWKTGLPRMRAAVKLQMPVFLLSERSKT